MSRTVADVAALRFHAREYRYEARQLVGNGPLPSPESAPDGWHDLILKADEADRLANAMETLLATHIVTKDGLQASHPFNAKAQMVEVYALNGAVIYKGLRSFFQSRIQMGDFFGYDLQEWKATQ